MNSEAVKQWYRSLGKRYGARAGKASAERLTPEERSARAKKASDAALARYTPEERSARARKAAAKGWATRRKNAYRPERRHEK